MASSPLKPSSDDSRPTSMLNWSKDEGSQRLGSITRLSDRAAYISQDWLGCRRKTVLSPSSSDQRL